MVFDVSIFAMFFLINVCYCKDNPTNVTLGRLDGTWRKRVEITLSLMAVVIIPAISESNNDAFINVSAGVYEQDYRFKAHKNL